MSTADDPRTAFAQMILGDTDEPARAVDAPIPRLPAPNPAQGASGRAQPPPPDPRGAFAAALHEAVRASLYRPGRNDGGWTELTPTEN